MLRRRSYGAGLSNANMGDTPVTTIYELRPARANRALCAYDSEARAKTERDRARDRGVPLRLFKVTLVRQEEEIA